MSDDSRVVAFLSPDDEGRGNGLGMLMHNNAQSQALRAYFEPQGIRFIDLIPLSLLAEAESENQTILVNAVAWMDLANEREKNIAALQSRLEQEQASLQFVQAKLDAVAEVVNAIARRQQDEQRRVLHSEYSKGRAAAFEAVLDELRAALGGELGNEEVR